MLAIQEVRLARDASLGNGTRESGQPLCRIELAPGVELGEVLVAFRNPQLCTFLDMEGGESEPEETGEEEPEGPGTPIHESKIPAEYRQPLINAGLHTVEDVIRFRKQKELTTINGIGRKSADAIEAAI